MSYSERMLPENLRSLAFGSITGAFVAVGTPLEHPIRMLFLKNLTDETIEFSVDGINAFDVLPLSSAQVEDYCSNKVTEDGAFLSRGTKIYARHLGVAPTVGGVYVSTRYGKGD